MFYRGTTVHGKLSYVEAQVPRATLSDDRVSGKRPRELQMHEVFNLQLPEVQPILDSLVLPLTSHGLLLFSAVPP